MEKLNIIFTINPALYTKNPNSSELGRKIVSNSIELIDELGFEAFTFRKLGLRIGSNESSIYRYFESKHILLLYLICWYWSWVEYKIAFAITNVDSSKVKLQEAIRILTDQVTVDNSFSYINEVLLHKIIIAESSKAYHTKDVDSENEKGYFQAYKRIVGRVSDLVIDINPSFKFPHMLISTIIEGAQNLRFFSEHLPSLTDNNKEKNTIVTFYTDLIFKTIS